MRIPRFEIVRTNAGWHTRLVAGNGEVVMTSEVYTRKEAAQEAISFVRDSPGILALAVTEVDERGQG